MPTPKQHKENICITNTSREIPTHYLRISNLNHPIRIRNVPRFLKPQLRIHKKSHSSSLPRRSLTGLDISLKKQQHTKPEANHLQAVILCRAQTKDVSHTTGSYKWK
jgi:hypothetical protein